MKRDVTPLSLFALTLFSSAAWACPTYETTYVDALIAAPFVALPYTLLAAGVIAFQASSWFKRRLAGWVLATLGAWAICTLGVAVGFAISEIDGFSRNVEAAILLSTPLVFQVAYLMRLHARRPKG